ncbi:MAG: VOC family protein [Planctomycetota bacterium]|nr:VOC family protein [Planctomycetota bacterium]
MRFRSLVFACVFVAAASAVVAADGVVSTMRNVSAVAEARGFSLMPANDLSGKTYLGVLAPTQAFEIVRPDNGRVTIGRLYTSCTCVQLVSPKRNFQQGERAVLELRNVRPTPPQGQHYAIYVQITSPIRTTLRYDTFVQSSQFVTQPEPVVEPAPAVRAPATTLVEEMAMEAEEELEETAQPRIVLEAESAAERTGDAVDAVVDAATESVEFAETADTTDAEPERAEAIAVETPRRADADVDGVPQRIAVITLGVADLPRSIKFYEDIGWKPLGRGKYDNIAFFQMNGQVLSLYPMEDLLRDQYILGRDTMGGGATLAILVNNREEAEKAFQSFVNAGGTPLRHPAELLSGAVTGYVADPDGHSWEISAVPHFQLNDKGELWLDEK